jgi:hypothetical protein
LLDQLGGAAKRSEKVLHFLKLTLAQHGLQAEEAVEVVILKVEMTLWLKLGRDLRRQVSN